MRPPCDEAQIRSGNAGTSCAATAQTWILAATIVASSMAFIDSTVVNVALPALQASFHSTVADVQWVVESYGLLLAALILVGGSLGDIFGRRLIFLLGVLIFAAASAGCGLAVSIHQLLIARSIQGIGAALLVPGSLAIISTSFDQKTRGAAIGTWSGFTAITTALGPVLGGWLVQHASWRWVFFINLPLAAIVIIISLWHIPESRATIRGHLDWLGALLVTIGLAGLVNGIIASESTPWTQAVVWISVTIGCACLILFLFVEATAPAPMVPLAIFRSASFSGANLLTLALYAAIGIFFFLFPLDLIQVQHYSATATGAATLPFIILMFLLSRWSGGLVARYGSRLPLVIGPLVAASGFLLFAVPSVGGNYWTSFFPAVIVLGLGMAITVAPLTTVVMNGVSEDRVGTASGINNAVARVASVLAIAVLGVVMIQAFGTHLNQSLSHLSLPSQALKDLQTSEIKLAGLEVPTGLDPVTTAAITQSIAAAFIFGFRVVMAICALLSAAGSAVAGRMIPHRPKAGLL
jgi:EmrB/QacA subfamily drug resistance transporter